MHEFEHPFLEARGCNDCDETFCVDCSKDKHPFEDELEKERLWGNEDVQVLSMIKKCNNAEGVINLKVRECPLFERVPEGGIKKRQI